MSHYWTTDDVNNGLCRLVDLGRVKPAQVVDVNSDVVELTRLDTSPAGIVRTAVEALLRASQQTRDLPSAVKAAAALLRYYAPPIKPSDLPKPQGDLPAPDWYDRNKRLSYQAGEPESSQTDRKTDAHRGDLALPHGMQGRPLPG